jgi:hypothetical protein
LGCGGASVSGRTGDPKHRNRVGGQRVIRGHQRSFLDQSLSDQDTVDPIAVQRKECVQSEHMCQLHRENAHGIHGLLFAEHALKR